MYIFGSLISACSYAETAKYKVKREGQRQNALVSKEVSYTKWADSSDEVFSLQMSRSSENYHFQYNLLDPPFWHISTVWLMGWLQKSLLP